MYRLKVTLELLTLVVRVLETGSFESRYLQTELDSSLYSSFPSGKVRNKGQNGQDCSSVTLFTIVLLYTYIMYEVDKRRQMTKYSQASNVNFLYGI